MGRPIDVLRYVPARAATLRAYETFRAFGGRLAPITANVACRSCSACCRTYDVPLEPHESGAGLDIDERDGTRYLRRDADGACVHLTASGCSVHALRPAACRVFDCREFAVVHAQVNNQPRLAEAIGQWDARPVGQREHATMSRLQGRAQAYVAQGALLIEATRRAFTEE